MVDHAISYNSRLTTRRFVTKNYQKKKKSGNAVGKFQSSRLTFDSAYSTWRQSWNNHGRPIAFFEIENPRPMKVGAAWSGAAKYAATNEGERL